MSETNAFVNGRRIRLRLDGAGPPIVLLHGFSGDSTTWDEFRASMQDDYRLIAPDILGHGKSAKPAEADRYRMPSVGSDILGLLDRLKISQAHLLGYSMGGRLALYLALRHRSRFRSLILESASPGIADPRERDDRRRGDESLAHRIESRGVESFVDFWESLPLWDSQRSLSAETRMRQRRQRLGNDAIGLANSLRGMGAGAQPNLWQEMSRLTLPTLLLVGEKDPKFRAINQSMARRIPNASLRMIPGAGHNTHLERPMRFVEEIRSFLSRL